MLSIITNFGCDQACPYCIYRQILPSTLDPPEDYYERLELAIRNVPGDVFSISGGGDPLHNFENNQLFWKTIARLCHKYNRQIDIHTAYLPEMISYFPHVRDILRKPVIHCFPSTWQQAKPQLLVLQKLVSQMRINFVIDHTLEAIASDIEAFCNANKLSFSYRQLVGTNLEAVIDSKFYTTVSERSPYGRYVMQDDYNLYFTPQGDIELKFMEL